MTNDLVPAVDQNAVLRALNLNPSDPNTQALLLICDRYRLDPLLKHVVLIQGRPYVTRDGYLHVAHQSAQLDGIEIVDEGEEPGFWWARVSVFRKDMGRPFTYRGRYPKQGSGNKQYGPEMAVKCAEVAALRRAFNVSGVGAADERWDDPHVGAEPVAPDPLPGWDSLAEQAEAHQALSEAIRSAPDELRAVLNEWREASAIEGWPLPADKFVAVRTKFEELSQDPETEPF